MSDVLGATLLYLLKENGGDWTIDFRRSSYPTNCLMLAGFSRQDILNMLRKLAQAGQLIYRRLGRNIRVLARHPGEDMQNGGKAHQQQGDGNGRPAHARNGQRSRHGGSRQPKKRPPRGARR